MSGSVPIKKKPISKKITIKYLPETFILNDDTDNTDSQKINVAIIIPYRNRMEHLIHFFDNISSLETHGVSYDIFVVEQFNIEKFNRGLLLNIGYIASRHIKKYDRYIFHDVDSYPSQSLFNQYGLFLDKNIHYASPFLGYKYGYDKFVGGVIGLGSKDFEKANGFSTIFFGWGGEDDSFYTRMAVNSIPLYRPSTGSYRLDEHDIPTDDEYNMDRKKNIAYDKIHWRKNGLTKITKNNVHYSFVNESNFMKFEGHLVRSPKGGKLNIQKPMIVSPGISCFFVKSEFLKSSFDVDMQNVVADNKRRTKLKKSPNKRNTRKQENIPV